MATNDTDFPAWRQNAGYALWVVPMTATNTQLRYGKFRDLFIETLRPARDQNDEPLLDFTPDGAIRGQVRMPAGARHVDVYAKRRAGTVVELNIHNRSRRAVDDMDDLRYAVWECKVIEVRAQRLADLRERPAMLELAPGSAWDEGARAPGGAIAAAIWDLMLEDLRPVPRRFSWARNPWVWIHRVETPR